MSGSALHFNRVILYLRRTGNAAPDCPVEGHLAVFGIVEVHRIFMEHGLPLDVLFQVIRPADLVVKIEREKRLTLHELPDMEHRQEHGVMVLAVFSFVEVGVKEEMLEVYMAHFRGIGIVAATEEVPR